MNKRGGGSPRYHSSWSGTSGNVPLGSGTLRSVPNRLTSFIFGEVGLRKTCFRINSPAGSSRRWRWPELEAFEIDAESREVDLSYAKNQLLPNLSFFASYWSPGISGTQILYENGDPFSGVIIGRLPGKAVDSMKEALNFTYRNWSVGLKLTVSLNSILTRADYGLAKANLEQSKLRLKNQRQQILLEVKDAVRSVQTDYKRVKAYKVARELAEKKLEAEEKKLRVGLSTNYIVLQYQRDLTNAQGAELKAIIDYNLSLARLDKALGTTLKSRNISLSTL